VIVLLSGGLDSAVALYWAMRRTENVRTVTFDYGQKHHIEIESAHWISDVAGVPNEVIKLPFLDTSEMVVPGRNIIFLTIAATLDPNVVIGVSASDHEDFPDCRPEFIVSMQTALMHGLYQQIVIHTPLIHKIKKDVVLDAVKYGVPIGLTHTCYNGYLPCGECPACITRANGFKEAGISDIRG
jgi:7-cyano-7-deazaguanine synthase